MKTVDELISELKTKDSFILAIDGMCGSGKSTLARQLQDIFHCSLFHMDDFYLPMEKRTPERLSQPGGHMDYERFLETVLKPLSHQQDIQYQPFLCSTMSLSSKVETIPYNKKAIIEGSYSLHKELVQYYTDIIVLKISPDLQIKRLKQRNPKKLDAFQTQWIPLENHYFEAFQIFNKYPTIFIKQ